MEFPISYMYGEFEFEYTITKEGVVKAEYNVKTKCVVKEGMTKALIKCVGGDMKILKMLIDSGIVYFELIKEDEDGTCINKLPEVDDIFGDYSDIVSIYEKLIKMGILVNKCTFVRNKDGVVMMQLPRDMMMLVVEDKEETARSEYLTGDFIDNSIPKGMCSEAVKHFIKTSHEILTRSGPYSRLLHV